MNKSTLNLFNAIQITDPHLRTTDDIQTKLMKKTIKNGYILSPQVAAIATPKLLETISEVIGISGVKANNAFHKSWKIIRDTPQEELWEQAIIHYMTTYGFENLGMFREDAVYIPAEELKIPRIKESIKLVVIKGLTSEEILEKIVELAGSGIALHEDTLKDLMTIIEGNNYDSKFVKEIKNRELKAKLYDYYGIVPEEPVEFLRYILSKITDESLLIKNSYLIAKIKEGKTELHVKTLDGLLRKAPKDLASIFFRFKPLFLALKSVSKNKRFFNRLRKDAEDMHKPLPEDFLNSVTGKLKNGKKIITKNLNAELDKVNIFRKIRLAYALKFRTEPSDSIVYKVRNGKGYATEFEFDAHLHAEEALRTVLQSIQNDLKVRGKIIYIPDFINYALPATEKQFTGNFPTGSYVKVAQDMIVGIHWEDTNGRVDLDLSTISASGKVGWDRNYTGEGKSVLFSGDMTSAPKPKGATELFYIKKGDTEPKVMYVNYFNFQANNPVNTKIIVAQEKPIHFEQNYMVNPSNILAQANINIDKQQAILGLITTVDKENRFYFDFVTMGKTVTAYNEHSTTAREFLVNSLVNTLDFKEILKGAGAKVVSEKPEEGEFIDLSPEALDKTTIINLILNR